MPTAIRVPQIKKQSSKRSINVFLGEAICKLKIREFFRLHTSVAEDNVIIRRLYGFSYISARNTCKL